MTVWDLYGLDALLPDEDRRLQWQVRDFVTRRIRPDIEQWDAAEAAPVRELARELGELGLLGMTLDGYGCADRSAVAYGLACFELEAGDSAIRSLVSVSGSLAMVAIRRFGSLDLQQQWLPGLAAGQSVGAFALTEPAIGSDPAHLTTTARQDGSDWVLSGEKKWITNGGVADVVIVWAQTTNGIRGFAVPADSPGMHMTPIRHKRSLRASVTSQLELREVRVPQSACLEGARGIRAALSCLNEARFGIIFGALGAAADCLATATAYARNREQFGRPIAGFQLTQQKLVDMGIALGNGLLLALHLAQAKDRGDCSAQQISVGKLHSTRAAVDIARQSRSILGANGTTADFSVMRHMANLESVLTYEGTAEMHTLVVGQAMTGLPAFR